MGSRMHHVGRQVDRRMDIPGCPWQTLDTMYLFRTYPQPEYTLQDRAMLTHSREDACKGLLPPVLWYRFPYSKSSRGQIHYKRACAPLMGETITV